MLKKLAPGFYFEVNLKEELAFPEKVVSQKYMLVTLVSDISVLT